MTGSELICRRLHSLLFSLLLCCSAPLSQAKPDSLTIATGDNYFPFVDEQLPQHGWSSAIVVQAFDAAGVSVELHSLSWPEAYRKTRQLNFDAIYPYVYTDERGEAFLYSNPINVTHVRYYVASASDIIHSKDTVGRCFCLPQGYELAQSIREIHKPYDYTYQRRPTALDCALAVERQQCDIGFIDQHQSLRLFNDQQGRLLNLRTLPEEIGRTTLHLLVPKSHPRARQILEQFNQGLGALASSGERQKIDKRFALIAQ